MAYSFIKKRDSGAFCCEFWDIFKNNFLRTTYGGCFCKWESLQKMCLYLMMKIVGQLPIASLFSLHKKRKFSTWSNLGETVDLVTFTEEILNGKLLWNILGWAFSQIFDSVLNTAWKVFVFGVILVCIFPH